MSLLDVHRSWWGLILKMIFFLPIYNCELRGFSAYLKDKNGSTWPAFLRFWFWQKFCQKKSGQVEPFLSKHALRVILEFAN